MKRLYKSRKNKVIDGVCGGIAEYFEVDPVLIRIVFVMIFFLGGSGLLAYIVGMIIIPKRPYGTEEQPVPSKEDDVMEKKAIIPAQKMKEPAVSSGSLIVGIILVVLGALFLMKNLPFFHWNFWWWFDRYFWKFLIPGAIIAVGIVLILKSKETPE